MKYLLGEKDDHTGSRNICHLPFAEAEAAYQEEYHHPLRPRTYDMQEYERSLFEVGFTTVQFYLAFPDYKLPHLIVPADDARVADAIIDHFGTPREHDGNTGHLSEFAPALDRIYRSLGGLDVVKYLAPSFIILAKK